MKYFYNIVLKALNLCLISQLIGSPLSLASGEAGSGSSTDNLNFAQANGVSCPLIRPTQEQMNDTQAVMSAIRNYNNANQEEECRIDENQNLASQLNTINRNNTPQDYRNFVRTESCDEEVRVRSLEIRKNSALQLGRAYDPNTSRTPPSLGSYQPCLIELEINLRQFESCVDNVFNELVVNERVRCEESNQDREIEAEEFAASQVERIEFAAITDSFSAINQVINNENCNASDLISPFMGVAQAALPAMLIGGGPAFTLAAPIFETFFGAVRNLFSGNNPTPEELLTAMAQEDAMNDQLCLNFELQQSAMMCNERTNFYQGVIQESQNELEEIASCRQSIIDSNPEFAIENTYTQLASYINEVTSRPGETDQSKIRQFEELADIIQTSEIPINSSGETQDYHEFLEGTFSEFQEAIRSLGRRSQERVALEQRIADSININNGVTNGEDITGRIIRILGRDDDPAVSKLLSSYEELQNYDEFETEDESMISFINRFKSDEDVMLLHRYLPDVLPNILPVIADHQDGSSRRVSNRREMYEELEARETLALQIRTLSSYDRQVTRQLANTQARLNTDESGNPRALNDRADDLASLLTIQGMYVNNGRLQDHITPMVNDLNNPEDSSVSTNSRVTSRTRNAVLEILQSNDGTVEQRLNRVAQVEAEHGHSSLVTKNKLTKLHTLISNCVIGQNNLSINDQEGDSINFRNSRNNKVDKCDEILKCASNYESPDEVLERLGNNMTNPDNYNRIKGTMCNNMARIDEFFNQISQRYINEGRLPNCD